MNNFVGNSNNNAEFAFNLPDDFANLVIVGQGAYGAVCKGHWDGIEVAVKKIPSYATSPETAKKVLREVEILQHFQYCEQVVACHAIFRSDILRSHNGNNNNYNSGDNSIINNSNSNSNNNSNSGVGNNGNVSSGGSSNRDIYVVMDYLPADLSTAMKKGVQMDEDRVRYIICQLLLALRALHFYGCIHRDISCRNILIDEDTRISLCDFGLSRFFDPEELLSFGVVTQWYRAPEIITDAKYSTKSDVFSVGVILGELLLQKHLFPGKPNDPADQLNKVFQILGTPDLALFEDKGGSYHSSSKNAKRYVEMYVMKRPLKSRLSQLKFETPHTPAAIDTLEQLLQFDPAVRPSADEALKLPWFNPLRENFISVEIECQDRHHAKVKFDPTVIPNNASTDGICRLIEEKVPLFTHEMTLKWRQLNEEGNNEEDQFEGEGGEGEGSDNCNQNSVNSGKKSTDHVT